MRVLAAHEADALGHRERRLEDAERHPLRDDVRDPDRETQRATGLTSQTAALRNLARVRPLVVGINIALVTLATATIILASMAAWELTFLVLVARPMTAFVFVLASIGRESDAG